MSDVGTGIFAKGRVVPEDVVALSALYIYMQVTKVSRANSASLPLLEAYMCF